MATYPILTNGIAGASSSSLSLYEAKNLDELDINDEHYDIYTTWGSHKITVIDANGESHIASDECKKYMYIDANPGWFGANFLFGTDHIYLSDSDSINENWNFKLELVGPYNDSTENAILNEMTCTYSIDPGLTTSSSLFPPYLTYTFKIRDNGNGSGSYELYGDFEKLYENNYQDYIVGNSNIEVEDQFSIRNFWEENSGMYVCPTAIFVSGVNEGYIESLQDKKIILGYNKGNHNKGNPNLEEYVNASWFSSKVNYNYVFFLSEGASYIDYQTSDAHQGQICNYIREQENDDDRWYIALSQYTPPNKQYYYVAYFNDKLGFGNRSVTFNNIPQDIIIESCDDLPIIYTDCLNVSDGSSCTISQTQFSRKDNTGKELVERLAEGEWLNSQDVKDVLKGLGAHTGYQYKQLICELKDRLEILPTYNINTLYGVKPLEFSNYNGQETETIAIDDIDCQEWLVETNFNCDDECEQQIDYLVEKKIREITTYCQNRYDNFNSYHSNDVAFKARLDECISFQSFYSSLVTNGIIRDLSSSCSVLSNDFVDKLVWILDIIKIAGPILAVALGTLDFVKVVASGDADKEMKSAFKRFGTRIIAAVLLFLVPVILAFLMDTFLGNQSGYDSDNPFCDIVDWSK